MLKILHLAPMNYAGVPYDFYKMHLASGEESRLITYHKNALDFPEDVCLNIPIPTFSIARKWRRRKVEEREKNPPAAAPVFKPGNTIEKFYFKVNDKFKEKTVEEVIEKYALDEFDIIHYDAGLDFYRDSRQAKKWKALGKKIVCCYYGSDLRIRGVVKELNEISDLNITSEFDHLALKRDLHYLFYPYDPSELPSLNNRINERITIVHSPTNRKYKGTGTIIPIMERIKKEKKIEFLLLENIPRPELLKIKAKADICIDQVGGHMGGTGYGKAGIETLAIGIPTITNMTKEYSDWLPKNPFTVANNGAELYTKLNELIESEQLRRDVGEMGKSWVQKYHGYENVNKKLMELYRLKKII